MKSKVITLSAISAAFLAICLTIGAYLTVTDVFMLVLCSVFVVLPLYLNSVKGSLIAYLVGGVLGFIFSNFNFLYTFIFPAYFTFFGLYPIVSFCLIKRNLNKALYFVIGALWCVAFFYGIFFYYTAVMGLDFFDINIDILWIKDYVLFYLWALAVLFYFIYDRYVFVIKKIVGFYLGKIIK